MAFFKNAVAFESKHGDVLKKRRGVLKTTIPREITSQGIPISTNN